MNKVPSINKNENIIQLGRLFRQFVPFFPQYESLHARARFWGSSTFDSIYILYRAIIIIIIITRRSRVSRVYARLLTHSGFSVP